MAEEQRRHYIGFRLAFGDDHQRLASGEQLGQAIQRARRRHGAGAPRKTMTRAPPGSS
jgi:hypothetical protein